MGFHFNFTNRDAKKLLFVLIAFAICLVSIYLIDAALGNPNGYFTRMFDLDRENNIPTWFSSTQLFVIGLIFFLKYRQPNPDDTLSSWFLLLIAAVFIFLSADEGASIHEKFEYVIKQVDFVPRFRGGVGAWIFGYLAIAVVLLLVTFRGFISMWKGYRSTVILMGIGMGMFLLGAVFLESIGYQFLKIGPEVTQQTFYFIEVSLEELLEMTGGSLMLFGTILFGLSEINANE